MSTRIISRLLCVLLLVVHAPSALACGPFFPNALLDDGDQAVLRAPIGNYRREIERIRASSTGRFRAVPPKERQSLRDQTAECDVADLVASLVAAKTPAADVQRIVNAYSAARQAMLRHEQAVEEWQERNTATKEPRTARPVAPRIDLPPGLPPEFADYLAGAIAYQQQDHENARAAWRRLLARPEDHRRWRSTWALFMLGLTPRDGEAVGEAIAPFQQVRDLAARGFHDSLGLAAASYGMEARAWLEAGVYAKAAELYLEQHACGDPTAVWSLRTVAARLLADDAAIKRGAAEPTLRRLLTAHILAGAGPFHEALEPKKVALWLAAVEAAAQQVVDADRLAMICYQQGQWDLAQRWIDRSPGDSGLALWVKAKLLFRSGKLDDARATLAQAVRALPPNEEWAQPSGPPVSASGEPLILKSAAVGELGVLLLSRQQYTEALGCLLDGGYWNDAAYIAERVLTADELKAFVDRQPAGAATRASNWGTVDPGYLLARRLTRIGRWKEARDYYPPNLRPRLDEYINNIRAGHDRKRPAAERAAALFTAARICRHEGLELLGTELGPDWSIAGGNYEWQEVLFARTDQKVSFRILAAKDEIERQRLSGVTPNKRFHYRYIAADHAWDAAALLPGNDDQTATILCTGGTWLKSRDPDAANRFYKALVVRCPDTALGKAAVAARWFPPITDPGTKPNQADDGK